MDTSRPRLLTNIFFSTRPGFFFWFTIQFIPHHRSKWMHGVYQGFMEHSVSPREDLWRPLNVLFISSPAVLNKWKTSTRQNLKPMSSYLLRNHSNSCSFWGVPQKLFRTSYQITSSGSCITLYGLEVCYFPITSLKTWILFFVLLIVFHGGLLSINLSLGGGVKGGMSRKWSGNWPFLIGLNIFFPICSQF